LAAAHALGASHRDLKPANLILAADGNLRITDFGVAAVLNLPTEEFHYRAPEQFGTEPASGPRTDVYQAGAIIYQLVTGKLPFTGTPAEIEHRVFEERPSDPSSYNNRIAWQLDWVIQKAMSKDPVERFPSATEFAEGLRLGLQETIGRPLDAISTTRTAPRPTAVPAPAKPVVVAAPVKPAAALSLEPIEIAPVPAIAKVEKVEAAPPAKPAATPVPPTPAPAATPAKATALSLEPIAAPAPVVAKVEPPPAKPAPAPAPAKPAPPKAAPAATKARVLFVDDDERILNAVRAVFRQEYDVLTAISGEAALEVVNAGGVHVVISDQRMPGMTGVELLRKVRANAPNAVRMLLTGYADLASLVGSINEGEIFRFVKKPWDNDELRKDVSDAVMIALELAEAAPPTAPTKSPRTAGSLLVIDPKESLARGLERLLAGEAQVIQVTTPADAAKALAANEIAAIVADLGAGMDGLVALFKQVKAKRPGVLTILLADEPDSELGIELINKAQIFRFLPKPVSAKDLRHQVAEALRRYAATRDSTLSNDGAGGSGANTAPAIARSA
jgi:eukaryotic-like serine/threonine-protein kinase